MKALLFPGQGSQYVGMGQDLAESVPAARIIFDRADEVLGFSLSKLMFEGPEATLRQTRNAQPAILTHALAAWAAMEPSWEPDSLMAAGHSLGEYAAYTAAGALRFEDALALVRRRGELMFEAGEAQPGTMAAVLGCDADTVDSVCTEIEGIVTPANVNSPGQIVISGEPSAVEAAGEKLREAGAKRVVVLNVSGAFHSPLMEPAAKGLEAALAGVEVRDAAFSVYANASAQEVTSSEAIRKSLVDQLLSPVLWEPTMRAMLARQPEECFEIGPGQVLKGLLRQTDRGVACRTMGKAEEIESFRRNG